MTANIYRLSHGPDSKIPVALNKSMIELLPDEVVDSLLDAIRNDTIKLLKKAQVNGRIEVRRG